MNKTLYIPFDGSKLILIKDESDVVYVAMRPIVENIGLDWKTQSKKLSQNKFNCGHMTTVASDGKQREMLFIPMKKLNGWLFSINPEKVREDLRDTIIKYQEECFIVLYEYWNKGEAIREKIQRELDEWREKEVESFDKGSNAGKELNNRKKEKHFIAYQIEKCEVNLLQPDLFYDEV